MYHVYKRSDTPIHPWAAHRHAGSNNILNDVRARYLILWAVEVLQRQGQWHYIFDFESRDTLEIIDPLGGSRRSAYPGGVDWRQWLGEGWERVDERRRWQILQQPAAPGAPTIRITNLRVGPGAVPPSN